MARTEIRDFYGRVMGYIEDLPNGDQILRNFYMKVLGRYDKAQNVTKNFYGRVVAKGNQLPMLLSMEKSKEDNKKNK